MHTNTRDSLLTSKPVFLTFYLCALILAELNSHGVNVYAGLIVHAILLLMLLTQSVLTSGEASKLYAAMAVIPLIRILTLSTPFWLTDQTNLFALVNLPLIVATVVAMTTLQYRPREIGLHLGRPWLQGLIVLIGIPIGILERLIIQPAPLAQSLALNDLLWPIVSLILFTGLSEELLFRGILQKAATDTLGERYGIVYISVLFGVMHIGWNSLLDVFFVTLIGMVFGFIAQRTNSIFGVALAHGLANIMLFLILPLSGI
jgi:uncharacterized protein